MGKQTGKASLCFQYWQGHFFAWLCQASTSSKRKKSNPDPTKNLPRGLEKDACYHPIHQHPITLHKLVCGYHVLYTKLYKVIFCVQGWCSSLQDVPLHGQSALLADEECSHCLSILSMSLQYCRSQKNRAYGQSDSFVLVKNK